MNILYINSKNPEKKKVGKAAGIIRKGGVVIFPTDTVYGIGARADRKVSVGRIFRIKGRAGNKPLILFIINKRDLNIYIKCIPAGAKKIIARFWPGALTMVFKAGRGIRFPVKDRRGTVGIRMPDHRFLLAVLKKAGVPFATTSANISGQKSPTSVKDIPETMLNKADLVIDGGRTSKGKASTVLDLTAEPFRVLREGAVSLKQLQKAVRASCFVHRVS